jgi:beta-lactamase class A
MDAPRLNRRQVVSLTAGTLLAAIGPLPTAEPTQARRLADLRLRSAVDFPPPRATAPSSPVGEQLAWILDQVNGDADDARLTDVARHFTDEFRDAVSAKTMLDSLRELAHSLPVVTLARFEGTVTETHAVAIVTTEAIDDWRITIGVEEEPPHRIESLYLTPVPYPLPFADPPADWDVFDAWLSSIAPRAGFQAVELVGGEAREVHGYEAEQPLAIGSAFKLYVLGELARQIAAGEASWEETLPIRDDLKSLPSGEMRHLRSGTRRPLRVYAEEMIATSDNTATDHLIARLGRERVEAALVDLGHANATLDVPLLMTREWFAFKLRLRFHDVLNYLAADAGGRRAFLAERVAPLAGDLTEEETWTWTRPLHIETVEWYASPADLCRAVAALDELAAEPALSSMPELLSAVPGVVFDARVWSYVGYKGGYETGVMSHTWLLERGDGRRFALAATINDPWQEIDAETMTRLMVPATALLAGEP